ncbi:hypothetical protein AMTR_s00103p00024060 [Amborella trichopoda]|uniref:Uncharacterized protein n=1 Tax=Amborella trichopoda TaxID=13333 RepID=W1NZM3_AMBTC|nr:hypothetical protein AMTR_s00103p00024060 [Amborella trichopoda]
MAETEYTVVSDSETSGEDKQQLPSVLDAAIGLDVGTYQCSVPYGMISGPSPPIAGLVNNVWRSTSPEEVLAIFQVELRVMAEVQLKRPVRNVVLTTPVSFSQFQHTHLERACAMAGLHVVRLMPEPTAAALLYAQQQQQVLHCNMGSGTEKVALIFNIGAGYCDVAVTATAGGVSQIKALSGAAIGGEDILQNVMHHLVPDMDKLYAIHGLNEIKAMAISKVLGREEFEKVNDKVFEKCESLVMQCLHDAKVEADGVSDVILVGGCSNIPKLRNLVLALCERENAYEGMDPLEAAVRGAALEGAVASGISDPLGNLDLLTIQATPLSLGIRVDGDNFMPIIHRNATRLARKDMAFTTAHDNQTEALILVDEGEGKVVEENHLLGFFKITGIPPAPKGSPEINVCMDVDASNVLRVMTGVTLPGTKAPVGPFMEVTMTTVDQGEDACNEVRMPTVDDGHGWCNEVDTKAPVGAFMEVRMPTVDHQIYAIGFKTTKFLREKGIQHQTTALNLDKTSIQAASKNSFFWRW